MMIRKMNTDDRRRLFNIYLQGVEEGNATFETEVDERKWWRQMKEADVFVIEEQTVVVGWVKMTFVSERPVYKGVRELSLYVDRAERGKGYGSLLLQHMIQFAEEQRDLDTTVTHLPGKHSQSDHATASGIHDCRKTRKNRASTVLDGETHYCWNEEVERLIKSIE